MNNLQEFPPIKWSLKHPRIAAWAVLSIGMVALLVIEARDVGLTLGNWIALIVATVLVAGAAIWIVSWEDVDETEPVEGRLSKTSTGEMKAAAESPTVVDTTPEQAQPEAPADASASEAPTETDAPAVKVEDPAQDEDDKPQS